MSAGIPCLDPFAQAERLAKWAHVSLGVEGAELLDILHSWRDKYGIALSNGALAVVVAHVTVGTGAQHIAHAHQRAA
jgi:hypothetical protein